MNNTNTPETPATTPPAVIVRAQVLKNGLEIAGGTAAAGTIVNVTQEAAKFHEERKEITVLGTL